MPNYSNYVAPQSIQPGGVGYSFGSMNWTSQVETPEVIPAVLPQAGARLAVTPPVPSQGNSSRTVTYETEFNAAPDAVSVSLQGAMRDVDAEYVTLDTDTDHAVTNVKVVTGVNSKFLRLLLTSITPNAATTIVGKISL